MPDETDSADRLSDLKQQHGERTAQVVVDQIVAAVRAGDESSLGELDAVMRRINADKLKRPGYR